MGLLELERWEYMVGAGYKGKLKKFQDEKTEPPKQSLLILYYGENSPEQVREIQVYFWGKKWGKKK